MLQLASAEMPELECESALVHRRLCRGLLLLLHVEDKLASAAGERIADQQRLLEEEEEEKKDIDRLEGKARKEDLRTMAVEDKRMRAEDAPTEGARPKEARRRE